MFVDAESLGPCDLGNAILFVCSSTETFNWFLNLSLCEKTGSMVHDLKPNPSFHPRTLGQRFRLLPRSKPLERWQLFKFCFLTPPPSHKQQTHTPLHRRKPINLLMLSQQNVFTSYVF